MNYSSSASTGNHNALTLVALWAPVVMVLILQQSPLLAYACLGFVFMNRKIRVQLKIGQCQVRPELPYLLILIILIFQRSTFLWFIWEVVHTSHNLWLITFKLFRSSNLLIQNVCTDLLPRYTSVVYSSLCYCWRLWRCQDASRGGIPWSNNLSSS